MKIKHATISTLFLSSLLAFGVFSSTTTQAKEITASHTAADIQASSHVSNIGWKPYQKENLVIGTTGQAKRLEAVKIKLNPEFGGNIQYKMHVQNIGWTKNVTNEQVAGTTGRALRAEAITIQLTGEAAKKYDIEYQAHVQNIGWTKPVRNGAVAGTTGKALRMEAIRVKLIDKKYDDDTNIEPEDPNKPEQKEPVLEVTDNQEIEQGDDFDERSLIEKVQDREDNDVDFSKVTIVKKVDTNQLGTQEIIFEYDGMIRKVNIYVSEKTNWPDGPFISAAKPVIEVNYGDYHHYTMHELTLRDKDGKVWQVHKKQQHLDIQVIGKINTKQPGTQTLTLKTDSASTEVTVKVRPKPVNVSYVDLDLGEEMYLPLSEAFVEKLNDWREAHVSELQGTNPLIRLPYNNGAEALSRRWLEHDINIDGGLGSFARASSNGFGYSGYFDATEEERLLTDDELLDVIITAFENNEGFESNGKNYEKMLSELYSCGVSMKIKKHNTDVYFDGYETTFSYLIIVSFTDADGNLSEEPPR